MTVGLYCWACHLVIQSVGWTSVESYILKRGNEQLLDNLEEGVIIQQDDNLEILYMNEAARKVGKKTEVRIQSMDDFLVTEFDQENKLFAFVDSKHFDSVSIIDTVKLVEEISVLDDYKSI